MYSSIYIMNKKLKYYQNKISDQISKFGDISFTGQVVFVIIVLVISWSGARAIQTNYNLQEQVAKLKQQNALSSLENNNISLQNEYYNSNQYLELSARQNLGLAFPGEKELLVPQSVALTYTTNLTSNNGTLKANNNNEPSYQKNFQEWVDFFFHRNDFNNT